jgi:hypothetical protein
VSSQPLSVYYVQSELLQDYYAEGEPPEPYRICVMVTARSRSQARWLAYKSDHKHFNADVRDMPKFTCRKLGLSDFGDFRVMNDQEAEPWWHRLAVIETAEFCHCCGAPEGTACVCDVELVSGNDQETGPWEERVCLSHERRV